ncbi:hypothetical protein FACS1894184_13670 [Clostridia bacterium]|nr:hypothetical protein FACS1894184_13670 [Clostridia bacterium]
MYENEMFTAIIAIGLAVMGAMTRMLNTEKNTKWTVWLVLAEFVTSVFMGILILFLTSELGTSKNMTCVLSGIAGWLGPKALDGIIASVGSKTGIKLSKDDQEVKPSNPNKTNSSEARDDNDSSK